MEAVKDNMVYRVTEADAETYRKKGFDIYNNGVLVKHGVGKVVTIDAYESLMEQIEQLMAENAELTSKLKKLEKKAKEEK